MSLPALATVSDLALMLDIEIVDEDPRARALLTHASTLVRAAAGQLWVDTSGDLVANIPDLATTITVASAARGWGNPAGLTEETTGPFRWQARDAAGMALTELERDQLSTFSPGGATGLSTIRVVAPRGASASRWLDRYSDWGGETIDQGIEEGDANWDGADDWFDDGTGS